MNTKRRQKLMAANKIENKQDEFNSKPKEIHRYDSKNIKLRARKVTDKRCGSLMNFKNNSSKQKPQCAN